MTSCRICGCCTTRHADDTVIQAPTEAYTCVMIRYKKSTYDIFDVELVAETYIYVYTYTYSVRLAALT